MIKLNQRRSRGSVQSTVLRITLPTPKHIIDAMTMTTIGTDMNPEDDQRSPVPTTRDITKSMTLLIPPHVTALIPHMVVDIIMPILPTQLQTEFLTILHIVVDITSRMILRIPVDLAALTLHIMIEMNRVIRLLVRPQIHTQAPQPTHLMVEQHPNLDVEARHCSL